MSIVLQARINNKIRKFTLINIIQINYFQLFQKEKIVIQSACKS